jgi:Tol biopolymer transport system component
MERRAMNSSIHFRCQKSLGALAAMLALATSLAYAAERDARCSLYTVGADGQGVEYIGGAPGFHGCGSPVFSGDGTMIAFDVYPGFFDYQQGRVFVYAASGPFRGSFRDLGYGNAPSWSPDDRQIAFMLNPGTPDDEEGGVWTMNSDGSDRRRIANGWAPTWSPDGKKIAFLSQNNCVSLYDVADESVDAVSPDDFHEIWAGAAWSPDSKRLAFIGRHDGERKLAVIDADGAADSLRILFTENESIGFPRAKPAWSPTGQQILFQVRNGEPTSHYDRVFNNYIYSMAVDVPSAPALLEGAEIGAMNTSPGFSPNGKQVVFSSQR